ncbi:ATP-binding cassette domain-containing protein [Paenibacillus senegalimassiliensis]|uniref:ATP-binding cassette domain-containing protein n=1 Tax=Paenibacillus senegalimassiliensis TaxID=1737426 RepID=UPI00073E9458|nr:ABC transporter ATP-binding protein [Paenibacillus senegalimassiliensis]
MLSARKYGWLDLIRIPFKIIPVHTTTTILYMLLDAFIPAYQTIVVALFINTATDIFNGAEQLRAIYTPIALIMAYIIFTHLLPNIMKIIDVSGKNKLSLVLKKEIVLKRNRLEYKHIENNETQELINRVCADPIDNFTNGFNNLLNFLNLVIGTVSLLIIVMSSSLVTGGLILLVTIPLFYLATKLGKQNYFINKEAQKIKRRYGYLAEILTHREYAEERSLFGYTPALSDTYKNLYDESYNIEKKMQVRTFINLKSGSMVALVIGIVVVAMLLPSLRTGSLTVGLYIALVTAILNLVQRMSWQLSDTMRQHAHVQEYLKDFSCFMRLSEKEGASDLPIKLADDFHFSSLEFKGVSFKYPGTDKLVLNNCSFKMSGEKKYALVGANGAGKTTIVKLLVGMYEDYTGDIFINNKNLKRYAFSELKAMIAVVYQNYAQYALTFKANIQLGNVLDMDNEKLQQVIRQMKLENVVNELEDGVETQLGKIKANSKDLSGGQWQKLAIARLVYADAPINILDEPTAALDPLEESRLYEMFGAINTGKFNIYITHRMGAAKISDEILVVSEGQIVEQGSHQNLMQHKDGIYKSMFSSQKSWYEMGRNIHYE